MILKNKYIFGCLIQFYELEMLNEHIHSCKKMLEGIENPENVTFEFCFSTQQYLEKVDWDYFGKKYRNIFKVMYCPPDDIEQYHNDCLKRIFEDKILVNGLYPSKLKLQIKTNKSEFYNIASYRRDFCYDFQDKADVILWSETDSLWPSQTLRILDQLHESVKEITPKYIVNFADRKLWDNSFAPLHPKYKDVKFVDDEDWQFNAIESGKGYMSWGEMEDVNNIPFESIEIVSFDNPRFDGSCVGFSTDLLKSGINIPHALIHNSEDVSLGVIAKKLLGDEFVQYNISNILHVHNRRHPKKRMGVLNETNPLGKCTANDKGEWWNILEQSSKQNFDNLFKQKSFITNEEVLNKISKLC